MKDASKLLALLKRLEHAYRETLKDARLAEHLDQEQAAEDLRLQAEQIRHRADRVVAEIQSLTH